MKESEVVGKYCIGTSVECARTHVKHSDCKIVSVAVYLILFMGTSLDIINR